MTKSLYETFEAKLTEENFDKAGDFFSAGPTSFAPGQIATQNGAIQFHVIGEKPNDPAFSSIMNENMDILIGMGGLVKSAMDRNYPLGGNADDKALDINNWRKVIGHIPMLAPQQAKSNEYTHQVAGVKISGEFLQMLAKAAITEGASILTDFQAWLQKMGDVMFSVQSKSQQYRMVTCTYLCYLQSNGVGGWYDWASLVLREVYFKAGFQEFNGVCVKAQNISIDMRFTEYMNIVPCRFFRTGGDFHDKWKNLLNPAATKQFEEAGNYFGAPATPQDDLTPRISA
jgi:virulence factor Evf-like protein